MTLHVREWGKPGGRPFLFWHALGPVGSGATLAEVAPLLAARGFHVAAPDGPGFGASPVVPSEQYEIAVLAQLALEVADERGWERFSMSGHSWGGAVALAVAALAPGRVNALVLLDAGHIDYRLIEQDWDKPVEQWIAEARTMSWESREAFEAELRSEIDPSRPGLFDCYRPGLREHDGRLEGVPPEAGGAARWGLARQPVSAFWATVTEHAIPTLLLLATKEPHVDQNRDHVPRFEEALPHAEVRWVPDAGHDLLADVGPPLGDEIADWLLGELAEPPDRRRESGG